jgi:hypothetical protein
MLDIAEVEADTPINLPGARGICLIGFKNDHPGCIYRTQQITTTEYVIIPPTDFVVYLSMYSQRFGERNEQSLDYCKIPCQGERKTAKFQVGYRGRQKANTEYQNFAL